MKAVFGAIDEVHIHIGRSRSFKAGGWQPGRESRVTNRQSYDYRSRPCDIPMHQDRCIDANYKTRANSDTEGFLALISELFDLNF